MALKLFYHPLSSFCHKALIGLYENNIPFEPVSVNLADAQSSAEMRALWPVAKFPVLRDEVRGQTVPEATVIIEYLDQHYAAHKLLPADPDRAIKARIWDRFFDLYIHMPMQKIAGDNIRSAELRDPHGVAEARATIEKSYAILEQELGDRTWALGDDYGLVDCAASPALFYASLAVPFSDATPKLRAYYGRLVKRPSYLRALKEAEPFFDWVPLDVKPTLPV
ncbi:MAG: glutathione S-transferase family protein [Proteobacteria bacterium]|nr:glutathione S-transferase family protein [Pseudomonadota bacterium]